MNNARFTRLYEIFDVFTTQAFCGNPVAIVYEAEGLGDVQMSAIAREFNLSKTVFMLAPQNPVHGVSVRIFRPDGEIPFAGHSTIGAAVSLALRQKQQMGLLVTIEEKIGLVRCAVNPGEKAPFAEFDLPKLPVLNPLPVESEIFATAFGIENSAIGFENHVPGLWDAGVPFFFVPVNHLATMASVSPDPLFIVQNFKKINGRIPSFYLYCREAQCFENMFHARMFRPDGSEDAATGSAASAFVGVVQHFDCLPDGHKQIWLEQGLEIGRPSRIRLAWDVEKGKIISARIGGHAVRVAQGEIGCRA